MRRRARAVALVLALLGGGLLATTSRADWPLGANIVSVDNAHDEQGDGATLDAAISANGRYVVFATRASNFFADGDPDPPGETRQGGIFRYDLQTGALDLVADGDTVRQSDGSLVFRGAANPSVSADGRYVAFSTAQQLSPADTNDNIDVYVRDMSVPVGADRRASGAYTLVSAKDSGTAAASYAAPSQPQPGKNPGSDVWPNTAISADGRYVAFRSVAGSDLPDHAATDTPPGQVLVRDLRAQRTVLVTRKQSPSGDPAGGAAGPAVISGDGSTVAWTGSNAIQQTPFLAGEVVTNANYYLWRRWPDAGGATRRITGMVDLDDPACDHSGTVQVSTSVQGPCYGPLTAQEEDFGDISTVAPAMSSDGNIVVFLTTAGPRPLSKSEATLDLWVTSMAPGVSRKAGSRELTEVGTPDQGASLPPIESAAISADGRHVLFTSSRILFTLPSPAPTGSFRPQSDARELYSIDLNTNTLQRVVRGYDGTPANGSEFANATMTADGSTIAFVSQASNLLFGDANELADAFTITQTPPRPSAPPPRGFNSLPAGFNVAGAGGGSGPAPVGGSPSPCRRGAAAGGHDARGGAPDRRRPGGGTGGVARHAQESVSARPARPGAGQRQGRRHDDARTAPGCALRRRLAPRGQAQRRCNGELHPGGSGPGAQQQRESELPPGGPATFAQAPLT